ncbi:hypothetical protein GCM10010484_39660 [Actinokineospora globicatena]
MTGWSQIAGSGLSLGLPQVLMLACFRISAGHALGSQPGTHGNNGWGRRSRHNQTDTPALYDRHITR